MKSRLFLTVMLGLAGVWRSPAVDYTALRAAIDAVPMQAGVSSPNGAVHFKPISDGGGFIGRFTRN